MIEFFLILFLILLNGFFSMAEMALVSSRKARLEGQAAKGDKKASEALKLAAQPEKFLGTVQFGITLIGILTGIFSGESFKEPIAGAIAKINIFAPYANTIATVIIVIIITFLSIVFGELLPKRIGLAQPERIAKATAGLMRIISKLASPFTWLVNKTASLFVKIFNINTDDNQVTEEEIKAIISEGTEQGTIEEAEQEIIERVFHLGDRNITSLMTHRSDIIWLPANATLNEVADTIKNAPHSSYPICDGEVDQITGIVSIKDLFQADGNTPLHSLKKEVMFVPENITAYQVLEQLKEKKSHTCFIVDEYGSIEGMITINDILEAIVGDMPVTAESDEYSITERSDGTYLTDAQIPYYDFLNYFNKAGWHTEGEQEFDTMAGFILQQLKRIPSEGEKLHWKGFDFEILDMDGVRIDKILVTISEEIREEMD
jgi:putative hemolysin